MNGSKRFEVADKAFEAIGILEFEYETLNLVSKEDSVKNADKEKKAESELTLITIDKIRG